MKEVVIDYVNGLEHDFELFYRNGFYIGHDDQIMWSDLSPEGSGTLILFRHWVAGDNLNSMAAPAHFSDLIPYLVPLG